MRSIECFVIACLCLLVGVILACFGGSQWMRGYKLESHGLLGSARIVRCYPWMEGKDGVKTYWVRVNFVPQGGERMNAEIRVSESYFEAHEDPSTSHVTVRYLPEDPAVVIIDGQSLFSIAVPIGLAFLALGVGLGVFGFRRAATENYWREDSLF